MSLKVNSWERNYMFMLDLRIKWQQCNIQYCTAVYADKMTQTKSWINKFCSSNKKIFLSWMPLLKALAWR